MARPTHCSVSNQDQPHMTANPCLCGLCTTHSLSQARLATCLAWIWFKRSTNSVTETPWSIPRPFWLQNTSLSSKQASKLPRPISTTWCGDTCPWFWTGLLNRNAGEAEGGTPSIAHVILLSTSSKPANQKDLRHAWDRAGRTVPWVRLHPLPMLKQ